MQVHHTEGYLGVDLGSSPFLRGPHNKDIVFLGFTLGFSPILVDYHMQVHHTEGYLGVDLQFLGSISGGPPTL